MVGIKISWRRMLTLLLALMFLVGSSGCKKSSPGKIKIGFLVKLPEEPWFQNEWKLAQRAADKYGFDLVKIGTPDAEKVLAAIDNLAAQGAQGFIICTPDVRLGPAIVAKARAQNLKLFTVDDQLVGADGKFLPVHHMGISAREIGRTVGAELAAEMKRRHWPLADTAACGITFDELDTARERTKGAMAALQAAGFLPDKIYTAGERTADTEGGFNATSALLTKHPEVKRWLVFSMNDEGVMGAVRCLEGRGFNRDTLIGVGIGGSTCLVEFRKDKPSGFYATCLLSPYRHGYETAEFMYRWIKDGIEPPADTRTAGIIITRDNYEKVMREQGLLD
jgi:L-arabinose transport system substrate-binding protein